MVSPTQDLYDIYTSHNNFPQNYKLVREDVYCDMLGSVLDQVIECDGLSDDEYSKKVHEFFNKIGFDLIIAEDEDWSKRNNLCMAKKRKIVGRVSLFFWDFH